MSTAATVAPNGIDLSGVSSVGEGIDAILNSGGPPPTVEDDAPPAPDEQEETPAEEEPAEEASDEGEEGTEPAELPEDEDEDPNLEDIKDGKNYKVKPSKMRKLIEASKFMKAVQEHYEPTPEAALKHYQEATAWNHMTVDFKSADPTNIGEFLNHWHEQSPEGVAVLAQQLPAFLDKTGQHAPLRAIESMVQNALITRNYNAVAQIAATPEAERTTAQKQALHKAQSLDYALTGRYMKDNEIVQQASQRSAARPQVDHREQEIARREKEYYDGQWQDVDSKYVTGAREAAVTEEIDKAFKPFEGKYSEKMLKSLKTSARQDIQEAISKRSEWKRNHDIAISGIERDFRQALRTKSRTNVAETVAPIIGEYRQFVSRVLPTIVKQLTPGATQATVDANKAKHEQLQRAARQSAPAGGGKAAPRSFIPKAAKSVDDALTALLG